MPQTGQTSIGEMTLEEFKVELRKGTRVIFQVRHAERPKMDPHDPTFGDSLPLTDEGVRTARLLGEALKEFAGEAQFYASPLRRTQMTAELIAEGMGVAQPEIPLEGKLGNESFYYNDALEVLAVFQPPENFFPACIEYFATTHQRGFNELHAATEALDAWLMTHMKRRFFVVATHDLYIAAYLSAHKAIPQFSKANWPRFLDAAATLISTDGTMRYALVRTGFSTGITGVPPAQR